MTNTAGRPTSRPPERTTVVPISAERLDRALDAALARNRSLFLSAGQMQRITEIDRRRSTGQTR